MTSKFFHSASAVILIFQLILAPCARAEAMTCEDLPTLTQTYLEARGNKDLIQSTQYLVRIRNFMNALAERSTQTRSYEEYVSALKFLDVHAADSGSRTAIYDVALALQSSWELTYGRRLSLTQQRRKDTAIKVGALGGGTGGLIGGSLLAALLGTSTLLRPQAAPQYFRILRHLLPLMGLTGAAGATTGMGIGNQLNASGWLDQDIPPAPAQVLRLGIFNDEFLESDDAFSQEILAASASITVGSIPYIVTSVRALKAANVAATPAKVHPLVFAGSIAASILVDKGVLWAADRHQFNHLKNELLNSVHSLNSAIEAQNEAALIASSDLLVQHTLQLAAFLNRAILEAQNEFLEEQDEVFEKWGPSGKHDLERYNEEHQEALSDLRESISEAASKGAYRLNADYEGYVVRNVLRHGDPIELAQLSTCRQLRAQTYISDFDSWYPGGRPLQEYLDELDQKSDAFLADELTAGQLQMDASHLLLQAAATLRRSGNDYAASILAVRLWTTLERMENFITQNLEDPDNKGNCP